MNKAWPDFPHRGAPRAPSEGDCHRHPTSLGLHINITSTQGGRDAFLKSVPQKALARRPPAPHPPTTAMNLHRDEYWNDNIMHKPPSASPQRSVDRKGPSAAEPNFPDRPRGTHRSSQQSTQVGLVWPEDAFATRTQSDTSWFDDLEAFRTQNRVQAPALGKGGKESRRIPSSPIKAAAPFSVEKKSSSQATDASGTLVGPARTNRAPLVRSVSMDSIQSSIRSPMPPSRRVLVVPVHQRGSPMPSTPTRQKRRQVCMKPQETTWSRFGSSDPPGDFADDRLEHDIGFASESSRTATTVTATQASSSQTTSTFHAMSPRTPPRKTASSMSATRSPTLSVPSLSTPVAQRTRIQRTPSGSRARVAVGSPRRKSNGSSSSSSRRGSMGSNTFSVSDKGGGEDDDAIFSKISFENLEQHFLFSEDQPARNKVGFYSPNPTPKKSLSRQRVSWNGQHPAGNAVRPNFGCFDDPLFPESAASLTRQDSIEDLQAIQARTNPTVPCSSIRRPGAKRTNTPRRSVPRNLTAEGENVMTKVSDPESGASPLPFPITMPTTITSDQARIPYHRSMAKRLKDRQDEERAQLLSQIRSRSALPTCTARPPTPPRQRRYGSATPAGTSGSTAAGAAPRPGQASPRRTASSSRPQVRGSGRRKQITKPPLVPDRAMSQYEQETGEQQRHLSLRQQPEGTTDIFGDSVDQLNAFDDSFSELITWARFHK